MNETEFDTSRAAQRARLKASSGNFNGKAVALHECLKWLLAVRQNLKASSADLVDVGFANAALPDNEGFKEYMANRRLDRPGTFAGAPPTPRQITFIRRESITALSKLLDVLELGKTALTDFIALLEGATAKDQTRIDVAEAVQFGKCRNATQVQEWVRRFNHREVGISKRRLQQILKEDYPSLTRPSGRPRKQKAK